MGAEKNDFFNHKKQILHNTDKSTVKITHIWVDGFGWENTILIESDFKYIEKLPTNKQGENLALALEKEGFNYLILKYENK